MRLRLMHNLTRQEKALDLLLDLLREEFSHLTERRPESVTQVELSIHQLVRQITAEREAALAMLGGARLSVYAEEIREESPEEADRLIRLTQNIDTREQACSIQAEKNSQLAMALLDQSHSLLDFVHQRLVPEKRETYSNRGRYFQSKRADSRLLKGRL
jgi:hypothetical protein